MFLLHAQRGNITNLATMKKRFQRMRVLLRVHCPPYSPLSYPLTQSAAWETAYGLQHSPELSREKQQCQILLVDARRRAAAAASRQSPPPSDHRHSPPCLPEGWTLQVTAHSHSASPLHTRYSPLFMPHLGTSLQPLPTPPPLPSSPPLLCRLAARQDPPASCSILLQCLHTSYAIRNAH
jgi:hypothetical protein